MPERGQMAGRGSALQLLQELSLDIARLEEGQRTIHDSLKSLYVQVSAEQQRQQATNQSFATRQTQIAASQEQSTQNTVRLEHELAGLARGSDVTGVASRLDRLSEELRAGMRDGQQTSQLALTLDRRLTLAETALHALQEQLHAKAQRSDDRLWDAFVRVLPWAIMAVMLTLLMQSGLLHK